ncbi:type II CRISPR RNA-guided endonuclease Cas9 [Lacihabitans sp. CCS-44]|uniref:type II CRISPR RNA-guided endonuclease Cas9 n=1 Tax=Lacihabitans sp. CCS-44 TaxID=2487331 RepID=UPI0020CE65B0|nr:type II CRISPR RNA-guided endonuclease Cas9 [Lacihabitans sp. CCS-44]MCP9753766.1 type II CRISPR RNA-guided endonuclease Cas9 [Lacihabitans sp. CCS-44]
MKTILGLDLGTTSIGWALIKEAENSENSSIVKLGTRIIQYDNFSKVDKTGKVSESKDPVADFNAGRGLSPNADRTAKRGARRNLDRFQLRRKNLLEILKEHNIIDENFVYAEDFKNSTFSSYRIRANATAEKISLSDFAKILLMINKKRGYKSSRKSKSEDEGMAVDGMAIAKEMYENDLTPGQYVFQRLKSNKKFIPDFYRSDIQNELNKVWEAQKVHHPQILTDEFKKQLTGKGLKATKEIFLGKYKIYTSDNKAQDKTLQKYDWRVKALTEKLDEEVLAFVISEINSNLNSSSGYLGAISDRSKELYFKKKTVGQYLYEQLERNRHARLKSQVFYRQDYLDEFERIWNIQAKYHKELTDNLKVEIRDVVIFYQRKLKSQKHLISNCEFEKYHKVIPKSSPLFQEFKIWQVLNNIELTNLATKEIIRPEDEELKFLFEELNIKGKLSKKQIIELLGYSEKVYDLNFKEIEGNNTNKSLYEAFRNILEREGYDLDLSTPADSIKNQTKILFNEAGINTSILEFDAEIDGDEFDKQTSHQLWHCLYSIEEDQELLNVLSKKFNFKEEYAKILSNISLQPDHGNLSSRAIKRIIPFLIAGNKYSEACALAGYNHSSSLTKEENESRVLKDQLDLLPKNSLRNPVVEKILNQMVHVINSVIKDPTLGKPDEIRIELARELKKSAKERDQMSANIAKATLEHEKFRKEIQAPPFSVKNPTRNDIIRYKLYLELATNGFHTIYSNTYIPAEQLFSKNFDIEHIIPKAKLFDDSFSNKTLEKRDINLKKADLTAFDFVTSNYPKEEIERFKNTVERLYREKSIGKAKYNKLLLPGNKIPEGFIERDLRDTQYIAKKAKQMLLEVFRNVTSTSGAVTDRLREDWGLVNIMQEINFDKFKKLGLTESIEKKDGSIKERITDWTKRNDHRHHAMDALTVAFTKPAFIQYLNNLNAKDQNTSKGKEILGIEAKYLEKIKEGSNGKKVFKQPLNNFRSIAKNHLEEILVSFKSKNKVVTKNKNLIKKKDGTIEKIELTPRGQLHKETVYGKIKSNVVEVVKIGGDFSLEKIKTVCNPIFRELLTSRLAQFENDPKKAFVGKNSLEKNPIYIDSLKTEKMPEKVKISYFEDEYTIKKEVGPDLKVDKVIDKGIRKILEVRLKHFDNNPKKAFVDLEKNPIWLNEEKGIAIKRVTISGVKNVEALHTKQNHLGQTILDEKGNPMPSDYVSTGNNHHVAIYRDQNEKLQEEIVSLYEAVARVNVGLPIIDKNPKNEKGEPNNWKLLFTMKQNEYFVFPDSDFDPKEIDLLDPKNAGEISKRLFRVQKMSIIKYGNITIRDFVFRNHLETTIVDKKELQGITYHQIKSLEPLERIVKVRVNHLGNIVHVGEY